MCGPGVCVRATAATENSEGRDAGRGGQTRGAGGIQRAGRRGAPASGGDPPA